jgi:vitamin B12 transporter
MNKTLLKIQLVLFTAFILILAGSAPALAMADEDMQTLEMFYEKKDLAVSATRFPQAVSQVAENLAIVTAAEIEAMNAHTLADVLNTIPGVQVEVHGGPGTIVFASVNGAPFRHILVLKDGVQLNNLTDNFADLGAIPVQNIERIEIVKGPASSSWGSALGGVINIITKMPRDEVKFGGMASASLGDRGTGDSRGEVSGTLDRFGYYLFAGNLASAGLRPATAVDENNFYSKLRWELPGQGNLLFSLGYNKGSRGEGQSTDFDFTTHDTYKYFLSTLSLTHPLSSALELELSGRAATKDTFNSLSQLSDGTEVAKVPGSEASYGTSAKLSWKQRWNSMVVGLDYDHGRVNLGDRNDPATTLLRKTDKWGIFANDTMEYAKLAITPGIRYDRTNFNGEFVSPSLGATYALTENTLLRGYVGQGYSLPSVLSTLPKEKILAYQAGIESSGLTYLWMKTTFFRNYIWDTTSVTGDKEKQIKQGVEAQARTVPFYRTSFSAGFTFLDAYSKATGQEIPNIARYTWDVGVHYDDRRSFRGTLAGHYIWWNTSSELNLLPGRYRAFIWDLNLDKKVFSIAEKDIELFFTVHNLFNGAQYVDGAFKNPPRWFEGGVRFKF